VRPAHRIRRLINAGLGRADLAVVRRSALDVMYGRHAASGHPPPLPPQADELLRSDHPQLREYERRYCDHPAATASQWTEDFVRERVDLRYFRGNNPYVWQHRDRTDPLRYGLTTYYARLEDRLALFDRLAEDGLFGAYTYDIDGVVVSRDLLDSIAELTFLDEELGLKSRVTTVLDIGAGYGRLAYRATTAFEKVVYLCTDAVPASTFLSEYYLDFRGVADRAKVLPLDEVAVAIEDRSIDVAVNIHSFSECPLNAIEWWLDLLAVNDVENLMIVPNRIRTKTALLSKERDGTRLDFMPSVQARGYDLVRTRPKYGGSDFMQAHGIFPTEYFLFRRRR
jgi:SAM-dependent methyltransferase